MRALIEYLRQLLNDAIRRRMERKKLFVRLAIKERLYQRRFILPNAVTLGNMFCGFLACVHAAGGRFDKAVYAIAFAILLDGLDGRVARKLNATSKFGLELDSFSDLVSFGVAPAFLMYNWCFLQQADQFGVFATFVYTLCAASRLARFNISVENLKSFTGLPTPGAAAMVVALVNMMNPIEQSTTMVAMGTTLMLVLAYLMVSKTEFFSIKLLRMSRLGLFARVFIGALIALIWYDTQVGFLTLASLYVASGPLGSIFKGTRKQTNATPPLEE